MQKKSWTFEISLLIFEVLAIIISGIAPFDRGIWYCEIFWSVSVLALLTGLARVFRFSRVSYSIFAVWILMQTIGAHYSFELVPFDWVTNAFGFERNHYDRCAHTVVGFFSWPAAEWLWRKHYVNPRGITAFLAVCMITALAGVWELVEWIYAVIDGGTVGAAFLGSQGDIWDAQKDILCDTTGAIVFAVLWRIFGGQERDEAQGAPVQANALAQEGELRSAKNDID